jgi:uncharacterized membrane protein YqaE (UPF0057 family)
VLVFVFNDLRRELVVPFLDIGWNVDHHCLNICNKVLYYLKYINSIIHTHYVQGHLVWHQSYHLNLKKKKLFFKEV